MLSIKVRAAKTKYDKAVAYISDDEVARLKEIMQDSRSRIILPSKVEWQPLGRQQPDTSNHVMD